MIELSTIRDLVAIFGVIAGFSYYVLTVRNTGKNQQQQLETRQAQLFMQMYNKWDDNLRESFNLICEIKYEDFSDFWRKYGSGSENDMTMHFSRMAFWMEGMGVLVKEGLVSMRLVALTWAGSSRMVWEKLSPIIDEWRVASNYPRLWSETEYLCTELIRYMDEHPELKT